jgi:hypothetical protein
VRIKLKINLKMTQVRIPSSVMVIVRVGFTVVALDYHEINSTPLVRETHPSIYCPQCQLHTVEKRVP